MECIFPNLYRIVREGNKGRSYAYFIKRKQGNLLLTCGAGTVRENLDEIEKLGGVHMQFINHNHDLGGQLHDEIYERFGAKLYHHELENKKVKQKTSCPSESYGDDGFQVGKDFEAIYFPSCGEGLSLFLWQHGGNGFLFTSHVIKMVNSEWNIGLSLKKMSKTSTPKQFASIANLPVNYTMPNVCQYGAEQYHTFNDITRKSFGLALRRKIREWETQAN
jgi:hypothetical protein